MPLRDLLRVDEAPSDELNAVISGFFGFSFHEPGSNSVSFARGRDEPVALTARFQRHVLTDVEPGPGLSDADVERLAEAVEGAVIRAGPTMIARRVYFSSIPVRGSWQVENRIAIASAPEAAPRPAALVGEHPFLVEVAFASSEDLRVRNLRMSRATFETGLILNLLLESSIDTHPPDAAFHWVIEPGGAGLGESRYLQEMYHYPGLALMDDAFTDLAGQPPLPVEPHQAYYERQGIAVGRELAIPDTLEVLFGRVANLDQDERDRFLRACFWLRASLRSWRFSQTAAFLAVVNAVESLLPAAEPDPCPECNLNRGPSRTSLFERFIDTHVERGEDEPRRREIYSQRSRLTHGGALLLGDTETLLAGINPAGVAEDDLASAARRLVRRAVVHWLYEPQSR